ncbi:unnamed protein product [Pleuronectes platessa]|uniref:Uncharacterized protein n=1 Tax=Pleuronectes platessa TaxID=8262 RepID=A0A9N7VIF6_PLEPL|nr:unnamed protein product [Pleuronectes platessa]
MEDRDEEWQRQRRDENKGRRKTRENVSQITNKRQPALCVSSPSCGVQEGLSGERGGGVNLDAHSFLLGKDKREKGGTQEVKRRERTKEAVKMEEEGKEGKEGRKLKRGGVHNKRRGAEQQCPGSVQPSCLQGTEHPAKYGHQDPALSYFL